MGRNLFFAQQDEIAKEKRRKQLAESGYVFGAHAKEDSILDKDKRIPKTKKMYYNALNLWMKFAEEQGVEGYKMGPGCATPDHTIIKEFLRWYSHCARGKKSKNGRPVMTSVLNCAERLFGGFEERMQIKIVMEDRSEVFNWIRRTLSGTEGTVENVEDPDHSFTKKDFLRMISSMWQVDHRRFMPGLLKVIIMLALQLYLFTGARIGAFIPAHEDRDQRGLRYEHITLVLFPSSTAPWKVVWKVNQVWLKGNRNPDYTVFGIGIRDTKRPQFASGYILLALALQHGALFGIETVEDLARFDLSSGQPIELRWKDEYLKKPVLRNVTADGPQDVPLTKERFCELLRGIVTTAGYNKSITVHKIRKNLGSVIEGKYGSTPVSQIYGHKDAGTYPKDYLLHCSSIDTVSAVLGEEEQSNHIEYFQGFERFYERGLPGELTAEIEASILQTPELVDTKHRIEQLESSNGDRESIATEKLNYRKALLRLRLAGLKEYQNRWIRERRDQRILNRGKEEPAFTENHVCTRAQSLLMPEIARISPLMSSDRELYSDEMLLFVEDLKTHCERDFDVAYLPHESPIQGHCPDEACLQEMKCLKKADRSAHIHKCVRRKIALDLQVSESELNFCYECMKWIQSIKWREHCSSHLQSWTTLHCEVIVYRHTVIRPGYCPFCLWNMGSFAEDRLNYWLTTTNLKRHIEEQHMLERQWHGAKPICGCGQTFDNELGLRHHLHDAHGLHKAIWLNPKTPRKRKHACKVEAQRPSNEPEPEGQCFKKLRFYRYPPPRHEHEYQLLDNTFLSVPTLQSFIEEHPEQDYGLDLSGQSTKNGTSSSVVSCFSATSSPSSSRPTTPGLEVIDPRILEPSEIDEEREGQPYGHISGQVKPPRISMDRQEIGNKSSVAMLRSPSPVQGLTIQPTLGFEINDPRTLRTPDHCSEDALPPCKNIASQLNPLNVCPSEAEAKTMSPSDMKESQCPSPGFVASKPIEGRKILRKDNLDFMSSISQCYNMEHKREINGPTQGLRDKMTRRGAGPVNSLRRPLTRAQTRQRSTPHSPDDLKIYKPRKKLKAEERRKLRQFKGQNWTLRQVGPHFADIDTLFLRQAWIDIRLPQRCTRSRANRKDS
ncbi:hypothetical protein N7488_005945 [Penicillium malachiteum]|nr:hypothetical protein N7488_005945 [Penicillium malachiteum]